MIETKNRRVLFSKEVQKLLHKKSTSLKGQKSPTAKINNMTLKENRKENTKHVLRIALDKFKQMRKGRINTLENQQENKLMPQSVKHIIDNSPNSIKKAVVRTDISDIEPTIGDKLFINIRNRVSALKIPQVNLPLQLFQVRPKQSNSILKINLKENFRQKILPPSTIDFKDSHLVQSRTPIAFQENFNDFYVKKNYNINLDRRLLLFNKRKSVVNITEHHNEISQVIGYNRQESDSIKSRLENRRSTMFSHIRKSKLSIINSVNNISSRRLSAISGRRESKPISAGTPLKPNRKILGRPSIESKVVQTIQTPRKHIQYNNKAIKIEIPKMDQECQIFYKTSANKFRSRHLRSEKSRLTSIPVNFTAYLSEEPSYSQSNTKSNVDLSNSCTIKEYGIDKIVHVLEKQLLKINNCNTTSNGYFKETKTPYTYEVDNNKYNSYWMDCISRVDSYVNLQNATDMGYYKVFVANNCFNQIAFQNEAAKNEYLNSLELPPKVSNYYFFFDKLQADIRKDHHELVPHK